MILIWKEIGEGLLPVSQKLGSSLLKQASERQISSLRWEPGAAFLNPWKPDLPCLSGFLPHDLVMGGDLVCQLRHYVKWNYTTFTKYNEIHLSFFILLILVMISCIYMSILSNCTFYICSVCMSIISPQNTLNENKIKIL